MDSFPGHACKHIKVDTVCEHGNNSKAYGIPHILGMTFICTCRLADWAKSESALKGSQSQYRQIKSLTLFLQLSEFIKHVLAQSDTYYNSYE